MPLSFFKMAFVNFDLKPSARFLSRLLVVRDFKHSFIWRSMGWSSDGGQVLKKFLTFVDIFIASSRVTGKIPNVDHDVIRVLKMDELIKCLQNVIIKCRWDDIPRIPLIHLFDIMSVTPNLKQQHFAIRPGFDGWGFRCRWLSIGTVDVAKLVYPGPLVTIHWVSNE